MKHLQHITEQSTAVNIVRVAFLLIILAGVVYSAAKNGFEL